MIKLCRSICEEPSRWSRIVASWTTVCAMHPRPFWAAARASHPLPSSSFTGRGQARRSDRRTVTLVAYRGELDYGLRHASAAILGGGAGFASVAQFLVHWSRAGEAFRSKNRHAGRVSWRVGLRSAPCIRGHSGRRRGLRIRCPVPRSLVAGRRGVPIEEPSRWSRIVASWTTVCAMHPRPFWAAARASHPLPSSSFTGRGQARRSDRRTVTLVAYRGELDYGLRHASAAILGGGAGFASVAQFLVHWSRAGEAF